MESWFVFGELGDTGPRAFGGSAHEAEDFLEFIFVGSSREKGAASVHFCHDAACRPNVDASVVSSTSQKDVWSAVPEGDDFVREGVDGDAKGTGETEIGEFELAFVVDEQVLGLEVAVEDTVFVAKGDSLEELVHEGFDRDVVELAPVTAGVHVFLEILVHVFKDEHQLIFRVNNVVQRDDVLMFQLFHQGDFSNSS